MIIMIIIFRHGLHNGGCNSKSTTRMAGRSRWRHYHDDDDVVDDDDDDVVDDNDDVVGGGDGDHEIRGC